MRNTDRRYAATVSSTHIEAPYHRGTLGEGATFMAPKGLRTQVARTVDACESDVASAKGDGPPTFALQTDSSPSITRIVLA